MPWSLWRLLRLRPVCEEIFFSTLMQQSSFCHNSSTWHDLTHIFGPLLRSARPDNDVVALSPADLVKSDTSRVLELVGTDAAERGFPFLGFVRKIPVTPEGDELRGIIDEAIALGKNASKRSTWYAANHWLPKDRVLDAFNGTCDSGAADLSVGVESLVSSPHGFLPSLQRIHFKHRCGNDAKVTTVHVKIAVTVPPRSAKVLAVAVGPYDALHGPEAWPIFSLPLWLVPEYSAVAAVVYLGPALHEGAPPRDMPTQAAFVHHSTAYTFYSQVDVPDLSLERYRFGGVLRFFMEAKHAHGKLGSWSFVLEGFGNVPFLVHRRNAADLHLDQSDIDLFFEHHSGR